VLKSFIYRNIHPKHVRSLGLLIFVISIITACQNNVSKKQNSAKAIVTLKQEQLIISNKNLLLSKLESTTIDLTILPKSKLKIKNTQTDLSLVNFNDFTSKEIQIARAETKIKFSKQILSAPLKVKAGLPQMKQNASRSILSFNLDQGLPGMVVKCMLQDQYGFLWIGTDNGLCRFNGDYFEVYNTSNGGLSSNVILSLCEDKIGNIWVGSDGGGVMILNLISKELFHYGNDIIIKIKQDKNRNIHIANRSKGYGIIDGTTLNFNHEIKYWQMNKMPINETSLVRDFAFDKEGKTWLAMDAGMLILNKIASNNDIQKCKQIIFNDDENKVYCIEQVGNEIWAGTKKYGLICLKSDSSNLELKCINKNIGLSSNSVLAIKYDDRENSLLVGTDGAGLDYLKLKSVNNHNLYFNLTNYNLNEGLQNDEVCSMLNDTQGRIWIGYYGGGGLSLLQSKGNEWLHLSENLGLKSSIVNHFFEDDESNIWLGTSGSGCEIITPNFKSFNLSTTQGLSDHEINSIAGDIEGNIWIGTAYSGINVLEKNKKTLRYISEEDGLSSNSIKNIISDNQKIWIGTEKGLDYYDKEKQQLFRIKFTNNESEIPVFSICKGIKNDIWVGTYGNGVYRLMANKEGSYNALHLSQKNGLPGNLVMSLYHQNNGTLFIGTDGAGIIELKPLANTTNTYQIKSITEKNGLADNSVLSLTASKNILYIGTGKGLTQLSLKDFSLSNIDKQQGLGALDFNNNASFTDKQGRLWWGIGSVASTMRPYFALPQRSRCFITEVNINDSSLNQIISINYGSKKLRELDKKAPYALHDNIKLPYHYNHFTFHFTGMQIANNNKTEYQFKLEGVDTSFTYRVNENVAEYRNLSPGKYIFKVSSKGYNGAWSDFDTLTFTISPPWYKTIWAYSFYLSFILGSIRFYFKWRLKYLKDQNLKLQQAVVEKTKEIYVKNVAMKESIEYAKGLQESILQKPESLKKLFPHSFLIYYPKDIVAGDFYWWHKRNDLIFITSADCTGHGVPGAMLNVVCINAINRAVIDEKLEDPGQILDRLIQLVAETFMHGDRKDGMDLSFCVYNEKEKTVKWAGANNPLWVIRNDKTVVELKADKQAIGGQDKTKTAKPFKTHDIQLRIGDSLYLFTDGFPDQFGGTKDLPKGKKLKYKHLLEKLIAINQLEMDKQDKALSDFFINWKGEIEQTDDVCLIGIKI
jgi:ligand-binding sensor domain-containing protein/serine phosphatase RsbU (regulator of sigma subunit)